MLETHAKILCMKRRDGWKPKRCFLPHGCPQPTQMNGDLHHCYLCTVNQQWQWCSDFWCSNNSGNTPSVTDRAILSTSKRIALTPSTDNKRRSKDEGSPMGRAPFAPLQLNMRVSSYWTLRVCFLSFSSQSSNNLRTWNCPLPQGNKPCRWHLEVVAWARKDLVGLLAKDSGFLRPKPWPLVGGLLTAKPSKCQFGRVHGEWFLIKLKNILFNCPPGLLFCSVL